MKRFLVFISLHLIYIHVVIILSFKADEHDWNVTEFEYLYYILLKLVK